MARKKTKTKKGQIEFGKKLTYFIVSFFLINFELIVIVSFILMAVFGDLSPLTELIAGTFAVAGTVITGTVAFYQWKTKAENVIKIKKALGLPIKDEDVNPQIDIYEDDDSVG